MSEDQRSRRLAVLDHVEHVLLNGLERVGTKNDPSNGIDFILQELKALKWVDELRDHVKEATSEP